MKRIAMLVTGLERGGAETQAFGRAAREHVRSFGLDRMIGAYAGLFERLPGGAG